MSLRQSRLLFAFVMTAHVLALVAVWFAALSPGWQITATVVLTASAIHYFQRLRKVGITALEADDSGYRLLDRGVWQDVQMQHALVTATLTVVEFKQANGSRLPLVVLPDSLTVDDYRRLRVWLRWVKPKSMHESDGVLTDRQG